MGTALKVIGVLTFILGVVISVLLVIFAFTWFLRILAFLLGFVGVLWFICYAVMDWWNECVMTGRRKKKGP